MVDLFGDQFPLSEQIAEVEREIALRRRVYPRWVEAGRLTEAKAERQIAVMRALLATLKGGMADG